MKERVLATRYIEALSNTLPDSQRATVFTDLKKVFENIVNDQVSWEFLRSPFTSIKIKKDIFKKKLDAVGIRNSKVTNFCQLIVDKHRHILLPYFVKELQHFLNVAANQMEAEVTVSLDFDDRLKRHLIQQFETKIQKKIQPTFVKDPDILGGFKIKIENTIFDGSVNNALNKFKRLIIEKD